MPAEKLPGEVQDMGAAVVSPDATSDPGDKAYSQSQSEAKLHHLEVLVVKAYLQMLLPKLTAQGNGSMSSSMEEVEEAETLRVVAEAPEGEDEVIETRKTVEEETIEERSFFNGFL